MSVNMLSVYSRHNLFKESVKDFYDNELSKIIKIRPVFIDTSNKTILEVNKVIKEIL